MTTQFTALRACASILFTVLATTASAQPRYTVTELPSLGGTLARARAVNNLGMAVGESRRPGETYEVVTAWLLPDHHPVYVTGSGITVALGDAVSDAGMVIGHMDTIGLAAFRASPPSGPVTPMPELGSRYGEAVGLNPHGDIVGWWASAGNSGNHPFLVRDGVFTALPVLGGIQGKAISINASGTIVGWSDSPSTIYSRAVRWDNGVPTEMLSNASITIAYSINNRGWAVGYTSGAPSPRYIAALWTDPATRLDLGVLNPAFWNNVAYGINNNDQVVGTSGQLAFLWEQGVMRDLNSLIDPASGWTLTTAYAISDSGYIVGEGTRNGQTRGFLLSPRCRADTDGDGQVAPADIAAFINRWQLSLQWATLAADFDADSTVTAADVGAFVSAWFAALTSGC